MINKWVLKQGIKSVVIRLPIILKILCNINKKFFVYKVESQKSYCDLNNSIIEMIDSRYERECRKKSLTKNNYENNQFDTMVRPVTQSYIAKLSNVEFIGETDGFFKDNTYYFERIEWDKKGAHNYLQNNIVALCEYRCLFNEKNLVDKYYDNGIVLLKMWSVNIFHFTFEVIGRLIIVDKYIDKNIPLFVDACVKDDIRSLRLLEMANKKKRPIVWVNNNERIHVKEAILPPCEAWGTFDQHILNVEKHGWIIDENISKEIRNTILDGYNPKKTYKKVYVARGDNKRLLNESGLIERLSAYGFEVFYPDKATFEDELDCFSTADCIVLCAGAAVTNIIYCKNTVKVYQICPWEFECASAIPIEDTLDFSINKISGKLIKKGQAMNLSTFIIEDKDITRIIEETKEL